MSIHHPLPALLRGYEYTLLLLIACLSLAFTGPGIRVLQLKPKQP